MRSLDTIVKNAATLRTSARLLPLLMASVVVTPPPASCQDSPRIDEAEEAQTQEANALDPQPLGPQPHEPQPHRPQPHRPQPHRPQPHRPQPHQPRDVRPHGAELPEPQAQEPQAQAPRLQEVASSEGLQVSAGSVRAGLVVAEGDFGASTWIDVWVPVGRFAFGGTMGLVALSSATATRSQFWMPIGPSASLAIPIGPIALGLQLGVGGWAGGVDDRLAGGAWFLGGARLGLRIHPEIELGAGFDLVYTIGRDRLLLWTPSLGLRWKLQGDSV